MIEELLIRQGSPTLAGLKTGSLFSASCTDCQMLCRELRCMNHDLVPKGLRLIPLRYSEVRVLLYLFRPARLRRDLARPEAQLLLDRAGYAGRSAEGCLRHLQERLLHSGEFPHEIGLFLGYPPIDVAGFIQNQGRNFHCMGCWKVYGDGLKAQALFVCYKACTAAYYHHWAAGCTIERLTVPESVDLF